MFFLAFLAPVFIFLFSVPPFTSSMQRSPPLPPLPSQTYTFWTLFLLTGLAAMIRNISFHLQVVLAFCSNFVWYTNYPDFFWFRDYATTISSLAVFCRLPFNNSQLKQAVSIFSRIAPVMVDLLCLLGIILWVQIFECQVWKLSVFFTLSSVNCVKVDQAEQIDETNETWWVWKFHLVTLKLGLCIVWIALVLLRLRNWNKCLILCNSWVQTCYVGRIDSRL